MMHKKEKHAVWPHKQSPMPTAARWTKPWKLLNVIFDFVGRISREFYERRNPTLVRFIDSCKYRRVTVFAKLTPNPTYGVRLTIDVRWISAAHPPGFCRSD